MEIVLNDIAWKYQCSDKYIVITNVKAGMDILMDLRKQDPSFKLYSAEKISGSEIAPDYFFGQLFSENEDILPRKYKTAIKTFLINFNKINEEKGTFKIDEYVSKQCGYAYVNKRPVFSIVTNPIFEHDSLAGIYESLDGKANTANLSNISRKEQIEKDYAIIENRIYEANPKHKINYGWGSLMDLDEKTAQLVLNCAVKVDKEGRHLAAKYKETYYSFRSHLKNCYHGYQDNSLPEYIKKQLEDSQEEID